MLFTNFSLIYHSAPNIISTINNIEKLHGDNFPLWENKMEIDLGMLELGIMPLRMISQKLQLLKLMVLMSSWRVTKRTLPLGSILTKYLLRL
jgi:hypothetical protein